MERLPRGFDVEAAFAYLSKRDRCLASWMRKLGPIPAYSQWQEAFDPVDSLARSILYQQLHGKAAAAIEARVEAALDSNRLHCDTLARIDDTELRACGVSGNKTLALRDLARREALGELPTLTQMEAMNDAEIIAALIPVRGIGRWTVEMMLMFRLGRPDVLPVDDLGVRKGAQVVDKLDALPTPKQLAVRGECWGPYRSYAGFYLWRIAEAAAGAAPVKRSQT